MDIDTSRHGLGAILSKNCRPIAFLSQALSPHAQRKSVYESELVAIVLTTQKWQHYLLRRHFIILIDQRNLKFLIDQRLLSEDKFKWTSKLLGLDFEIHYRLGFDNKAANDLSRKMSYSAISMAQTSIWDIIEAKVLLDEQLQTFIKGLIRG